MTGEPVDKTVPWVEETGMKYAFGYLSKGDMSSFMKDLGMSGYPSAVLVDPKGEIVWAGHPSSVNGSLIKKHIAGASTGPVGPAAIAKNWPEEAKAVRKAFLDGKYGKALEEAQKLGQDSSVLADVERVIGQQAARIKSCHEQGDYLGFSDMMRDAKKMLSGTPQFEELEKIEGELKSDRDAKAVMSAQKKLQKLAEQIREARKAKDVAKAERFVRQLVEKHPGTYVEASGKKLLDSAEKKRAGMDR